MNHDCYEWQVYYYFFLLLNDVITSQKYYYLSLLAWVARLFFAFIVATGTSTMMIIYY